MKDVYEVDSSKQSKRVTANVRGFLGTERINLSDNLLRRCTPEQIEAVMGHEMGHYVLNHGFRSLTFGSILIVLAFAWLRFGSERALVRWGGKWGVRGIIDVAVIPLMSLLLSTFVFVCTPILNTHQRAHEYEADMYGPNAARQPDASAEVNLMLGEYRKLGPGPVEEFIFFDHPSRRNRIYAAMRWKAEHLEEAPAGRSRRVNCPMRDADSAGASQGEPQNQMQRTSTAQATDARR